MTLLEKAKEKFQGITSLIQEMNQECQRLDGEVHKITEELKKELKEAWKEFEKIPEKPVEGRESGAMLEDLMKDYHRTTGS